MVAPIIDKTETELEAQIRYAARMWVDTGQPVWLRVWMKLVLLLDKERDRNEILD